ncbi:EcsC family protein [Oceanomicrobium pacificus]|uniref:EcsC family protein n=1 Tax=Oceanomicrobium pacificus TaxID=2692916 RepID=A0A6B0TQ33_9RHOB|nr:EcsC family protein [Oceanomicrobium pacificus]MXU63898.1 EcsC family protein [Oceanomicrobium pacificus]
MARPTSKQDRARATPPARADLARSLDAVLAEQAAFEHQRSTVLGRGAEKLTAPLGRGISRMVPPALVRRGLDAADRAAGIALGDRPAHDLDDIAACDAAALRVQALSAGSNAASGGAAGWFGGIGMTVDIPTTIAVAARNVRATGAAYGFTGDGAEERAFRLAILEMAATTGMEGRAQALGRINRMARGLTGGGGCAAASATDWVIETAVERVSRQVGAGLLGRKAAQIVPVLGGVIAAGVNASFQTDVSRAARYAYRQRWLMARQALPPPDGDGGTG